MLQKRKMSRRQMIQRSLLCGCSIAAIVPMLLLYVTSGGSEQCYSEHGRAIHRTEYRVKSNNCEVIDLAVVVRGCNASRDVTALIKSVLLYRHNPIKWHFVTDASAKHILSTLLRTWHLHGLAFKFYDIPKSTSDTTHLPTLTKSDNPCQLFIDALPVSVEKVISLDPTVLLTADIFHLWEVFNSMKTHGNALGIVRSPSGQQTKFRTGVMLLDLRSLRDKNWSLLWTQALSEVMEGKASSTNTMSHLYTTHHSLFFMLNSGWNVQLGEMSPFHGKPCSNKKYICAGHFENGSSTPTYLKQLFLQYDGNILREKLISCKSGEEFDENAMDYRAKMAEYNPPCTDLKREGSQERRTHPFFLEYNYVSEDRYDVTMLLHATLDRLVQMLEPMCQHWEGPMSIAVFLNDSEVSDLLTFISRSHVISSRQNIGYHLVYKEGVFYPSNPLRAIALNNARTPYVLFNDIDFLPSVGLYSYLKDTVRIFDFSDTVLVVPALETYENLQKFPFPHSKSVVTKLMVQKRVFQFHVSSFIRGHSPTDYVTWMNSTHSYEIQWQRGYEPYLVTSVNITPPDPRFVSRGSDKVSHIEEVYYKGYRFIVLPNAFLVHLPHPPSSDFVNQKANERYMECYRRRFKEWRLNMVQVYGHKPIEVLKSINV